MNTQCLYVSNNNVLTYCFSEFDKRATIAEIFRKLIFFIIVRWVKSYVMVLFGQPKNIVTKNRRGNSVYAKSTHSITVLFSVFVDLFY